MSDESLPRGPVCLVRALPGLGKSWRRRAGTVVLLLALAVSGLVATGAGITGPAMPGFVSGASSALMPRPARAVQASVATAAQDRAALEAFYHAAGGPGWIQNDNWLTDTELWKWHGVLTDDNGRVTELFLSDNNLAGSISPELGTLTRLKALHLHDNRFSSGANALRGPIPVELGHLVNLRRLSLNDNELTGPIPFELGNLVSLEQLHLGGNELSGPVPVDLGHLMNLWDLSLGDNRLTGSIPVELGNLVNLEQLYLGGNELSGPVPVEFGNLVNLWRLSLHDNELTGPIPVELGHLARLDYITLSDNLLTGTVPESLTQLSLDTFWIDGTGVCMPAGAGFQAWAATIENFRGDTCSGEVSSWTDHQIMPGVTPVRAVHVMELRRQVDAARLRCGLGSVTWIDPVIRPEVTPIKAVHITQLRAAIDAANQACSQMRPAWTDPQIVPGVTPVRAVHFAELRDAVLGLNDAPAANQAPELVGVIPTQTLTTGGNASRVDVARYFRDPDNDPLTYSAISASPGIVAASTSGSIVTLAPVAAGTTTVGVTASDGSLSAMQTIAVTVDASAPDHPGRCVVFIDEDYDWYPGISTHEFNVRFRNDCSFDVDIYIRGSLFDSSGQLAPPRGGGRGVENGALFWPGRDDWACGAWSSCSYRVLGQGDTGLDLDQGNYRVAYNWNACRAGSRACWPDWPSPPSSDAESCAHVFDEEVFRDSNDVVRYNATVINNCQFRILVRFLATVYESDGDRGEISDIESFAPGEEGFLCRDRGCFFSTPGNILLPPFASREELTLRSNWNICRLLDGGCPKPADPLGLSPK